MEGAQRELLRRLERLEGELDLAKHAPPRVALQRTADWDREIDSSIFTITAKEEVGVGMVADAIKEWLDACSYAPGQ
eukprot:5445579-Pyramimonas_sp.AAC.1